MPSLRPLLLPALILLVAGFARPSFAQAGPQFTPSDNSVNGSVDLQSLNVTFRIPLVHTRGRGLDQDLALVTNTNMYTISSNRWTNVAGTVWTGPNTSGLTLADLKVPVTCSYWNGHGTSYTSTYEHQKWIYVDQEGFTHTFYVPEYYDQATPCDYSPVGPQGGAYETGSGSLYLNPQVPMVLLPSGEKLEYWLTEDTNGNEISGITVDTLSRQVKVVTNGSTVQYQYQDSGGNWQTITENTQPFNIRTNFSCSGITEYTASNVNLPVSVQLPNGTQYAISYETTPGYQGYVTGRISKIILPAGGYVQYEWGTTNDGVSCSDGSTLNITRTVSDGTNTNTWQYSRSCSAPACTVTETLPQMPYDSAANQIVDTFMNGLQTQEEIYQGNTSGGTLLETIDTTWKPNSATPATRTVVLPNNQQSEVTTNYDNYSNLLERDEYDWGNGAPGPLVRKTVNTYLSSSAYQNEGIVNRLQTSVVYNGSGTIVAQTQYEYDNYTAGISASGAVQHDANYGTGFTTRGNVTAVKRWRSQDSSWMTTRFQYDDAGNVVSSTDPAGRTTTFSYADSWANTTCTPSGGNGAAYTTAITNALNQTAATSQYNSCTGTAASVTDANNQVTSFTYDSFGRLLQKTVPGGGQTTVTYADTATPPTATTSVKLSGTSNATSEVVYDGLGRVIQSQTTSDPAGTDYVDTTYDPLGRAYTLSNPYRNKSEGTYGVTTYKYDALGRAASVVDPDGNTVTTSYSGNCATVSDEQGKQKENCSDALGRLTGVTEDPSGLNYQTAYVYDALNDLTSVMQSNSRPRSFTYDSLGRRTQSVNPESGTVTYTYDADASCASPNSFPGDLVSRTDARGVRTCLQYDALHRVTRQNYSDGIPTASLAYDVSSGTGWTCPTGSIYPTGRLSQTSNGSAISGYCYDPVGRVATKYTCLPIVGGCTLVQTSAQYDLAGDLTQLTYPDGRVVAAQYDGAANLTQVQFASMNGTQVGYNYFSGAAYGAAGQLGSFGLGNGAAEAFTYTNRLQLAMHTLTAGGNTLLSYSYNFYDSSNHDNGNVMGITDNVTPGLSWTYGYDAVDRLTSAQTQATSGVDCFGQTYGYDAWGNLLQENVSKCTGYMLSATANSDNQLTNGGQTYNASGQMTGDGTHSYTFNAEDELTAVDGGGTATYTYDAEGNRVRKDVGSSWTQYVFFGGQVIAENTASGWTDYVFANDQRLTRATGTSSSGTVYYHADHLATARVETDASGNVLAQCTYAPFGQIISCSPDDAANHYRFTAQERDTETNVDNFLARNYTSQFGRFFQPDPAGTAAADPMNPQSWNRYAYVTNNPTNFIDPSGMDCGWSWTFSVEGAPAQHGGSSFPCDWESEPLSSAELVSPFGMGWNPCGYTGELCGQGDSGGGPTTPQKPQTKTPKVCSRGALKWKSLEWTVKAGPEIELGPVDVGFSLFKNFTTGQTGGKAEATIYDVAGLSLQKVNDPPAGISGDAPRELHGQFMGLDHNFSDSGSQTNFGSKSIGGARGGAMAGIGFEVSLNGDTYKRLASACDIITNP